MKKIIEKVPNPVSLLSKGKKIFEVYLSTPISPDEEYRDHRSHVDAMIKKFEDELGAGTIYSPGQSKEGIPELADPDVVAKGKLGALELSKRFIMVLPDKIYSSALVESGYALALDIPSVYFIKERVHLPSALQDICQNTKKVKIFKYEDFDDIINTFLKWEIRPT